MRIKIGNEGIHLIREAGDAALSHESAVTHHMRRLLNAMGIRKWKRIYPDRLGLTGCKQGVCTADKSGYAVVFWHERYAVEEAHKAFNAGRVCYARA